jgi:hypothetical protein
MIRSLTIILTFAAIISATTSAEARRALSMNGVSLNGASASAPAAIVAVELPENWRRPGDDK